MSPTRLPDKQPQQYHEQLQQELFAEASPSWNGPNQYLSSRNQQEQQQHQTLLMQQQQQHSLHVENVAAQRAAVEAVYIGRETLSTAVQQGEQLDRTQTMADETQYKLDRASRLLRGMTWSGWVTNMLTSQPTDPALAVAAAETVSGPQRPGVRVPPTVYDLDRMPSHLHATVQAIQNYHANLQVLEACETNDQKETCLTICRSMYATAQTALQQQQQQQQQSSGTSGQGYVIELKADLQILFDRQLACEKRVSPTNMRIAASAEASVHQQNARQLGLSTALTASTTAARPAQDPFMQQHQHEQEEQDQHLNFLSQHLTELHSIAHSLQGEVARQHETMNVLDTKSDSILQTTKQNTRRADRLVQSKSWRPSPIQYVQTITLRHASTGMYVAVIQGQMYLVPPTVTAHGDSPILFDIYQRGDKTTFLGFKHVRSQTWLGQSLLGQVTCTAKSMNRREEWELETAAGGGGGSSSSKGDDDATPLSAHDLVSTTAASDSTHVDVDDDGYATRIRHIRLLCVSAGWGAGGYLLVQPASNNHHAPNMAVDPIKPVSLTLIGCTTADKTKATIFYLQSR